MFPTFDAVVTRSPTGDVLDQSALDQSALDQSALDQSALDQSALDQSALEKETECTSWFASSGLVTNGAVGSLLNRICVVNPPLAAGIIVPKLSVSSTLILKRPNALAAVQPGQ